MTVGSGLALNPGETNLTKIVTTIRQMMEGRSNAVGTFTLRASQTTTTVTSPIVGPNSVIHWVPLTANAATANANMYVSAQGMGTFTITHASSVNVDQNFQFSVVG